MVKDRHDPFKPEPPASAERAPQVPESDLNPLDRPTAAEPAGYAMSLPEEQAWLTPAPRIEGLAPASGWVGRNLRSLPSVLLWGGGLVLLVAVLITAFSAGFLTRCPAATTG